MRTLKGYLSLVGKEVSDCDLTKSTKEQLSALLDAVTEHIVKQSVQLMYVTEHNMVTFNTLINTCKSMFSGEILNVINEYYNTINQLSYTHLKTKLVLPLFYFKSLYKPYNVRVEKKCYLFLSSFIHYILTEIIELASYRAKFEQHMRITPRDIYIGLLYDKELLHFIQHECNVKHLSCGTFPVEKITENNKECRKDTKFCLTVQPFNNIVRSIFAHLIHPEQPKIAKNAFPLIQRYVEYNVIKTLVKARMICLHGNRTKVTSNDILLTHNLNDVPL